MVPLGDRPLKADHPRISRTLRVRTIMTRGRIRPCNIQAVSPGRHWTDSKPIIKALTDPHDCLNYDQASGHVLNVVTDARPGLEAVGPVTGTLHQDGVTPTQTGTGH